MATQSTPYERLLALAEQAPVIDPIVASPGTSPLPAGQPAEGKAGAEYDVQLPADIGLMVLGETAERHIKIFSPPNKKGLDNHIDPALGLRGPSANGWRYG